MWLPPVWYLKLLGEGVYKGLSGWEDPRGELTILPKTPGYAMKPRFGYGPKSAKSSTSSTPIYESDNILLYIGVITGIIIFIIIIMSLL